MKCAACHEPITLACEDPACRHLAGVDWARPVIQAEWSADEVPGILEQFHAMAHHCREEFCPFFQLDAELDEVWKELGQ